MHVKVPMQWNAQACVLCVCGRAMDMSYEALLRLDEGVESNRGAQPEVLAQLPVSAWASATGGNAVQCSVCLENIEDGQQVKRLPCMCVFHVDCIDQCTRRSERCWVGLLCLTTV